MQAALFALLPASAGMRQVMMMLQHTEATLSWELTNETAALQPCTWERGRLCVAVRVDWCDRGSVQMVSVHHAGRIAWRGCSWDFISSVLKVGRGVF